VFVYAPAYCAGVSELPEEVTMICQVFTTRTLGSGVLAAALLGMPALAAAQSTDTSAPKDTLPPNWEIVGGFEGDTHDTSYSFFGPGYNHPISDNLAVTARFTGRYLSYSFRNGLGGDTTVNSPGISPAIGLRFGKSGRTARVQVGYGGKNEHRVVEDRNGNAVLDETRWRSGITLGGDVYYNLTKRDNVHALVSFGTEDDYLWSRVGYKHQMTNHDWKSNVTLYLGAEALTQGNSDIWSNNIGGIAEVLLVPAHLSLMFRSGYKHSTFDRGDDKNGPYYALGLYKRF
jgi:hypothetical protein